MKCYDCEQYNCRPSPVIICKTSLLHCC